MNRTSSFILDFIRHLLSAVANASLYGMEHPQVVRLTTQAYETALKALEERSEFSIAIIENELVIDGRPQDFTLFLDRFVQTLGDRGVGHMKVLQGITRQEITNFIVSMSRHGEESGSGINSGRHLELGRMDLATQTDTGERESESAGLSGSRESSVLLQSEPAPSSDGDSLREMSAREMTRFMEIYEAVNNRRKLKITGIIEIVSDFVAVFRKEGQALLLMATMRDADEYTFTHSTNVCLLNIAQAVSLGIDGQLLNDIGVAGMLHDIGKLFIPEEILGKKGALSDDEFRLMQSHPLKGARFLLETSGVPRLAIVNAFEHHLKYNLSGYPRVPANWRQSLCSHMTSISDVYDAMRTKRPYRKPLPPAKICSTMREIMGTELHPALTANFLGVMSNLMNDPSVLPFPAAT